MNRNPTQTLTAICPDGTRTTIRTSAGYTWAGLLRQASTWQLKAKGWVRDSVQRRTFAAARDEHAVTTGSVVVRLYDRAQLRVIDYFTAVGVEVTSMPRVAQVFAPGAGWKVLPELAPLNEGQLRRWNEKDGVTCINVIYQTRTPDFAIEELLRPAPSRPLLGGSLIGSRTFGERC